MPASASCRCRSSTKTTMCRRSIYGAGSYTLTKEKIGTRYVAVAVRTLVDPGRSRRTSSRSMRCRTRSRSSQASPGKFEVPDWDPASQKKVRDALLVLATTMPDFKKAFGTKDEVDPVRHLIGTAAAWGGNPDKDATYLNITPAKNDGNDGLQARGQGRAGRRLLVGQPLQRRRAITRRTPTTPIRSTTSPRRKAPTARSRSSSAAATARFRTACRS